MSKYKHIGLKKKSSLLVNLLRCSNSLDSSGFYKEADELTKLAQRPWWQNEAGEPLYSPEAIRAEENADSEPYYDYDDRDFDRHPDDELETEYESPDHVFQILQQNGIDKGSPHFTPGWAWYWEPYDGAIVFNEASLANQAAEALKKSGVDESTFFIVNETSGTARGHAKMYFENLSPAGGGGEDEVGMPEDFGYFGEMGMNEG